MTIYRLATLNQHLTSNPVLAEAHVLPALSLLYQTLLRKNRSDDVFSPDLAQHWQSSEDGCHWIFTLASAEFHDGSKVLASDVALSLAQHIWPGAASLMTEILRDLIVGVADTAQGELPAGIFADDAQAQVHLTLTQAYCPLLEILAHPAMGICKNTGAGMVGSGPMQIVQNMQNQHNQLVGKLEFLRFEAYSGSRKVPELLSLRGFASFSELKLALESDEVNFALLERHHQLRLLNLAQLSSTPLRDRWVGILIFNAASRLQDRALRLALYQQMQLAAQDAFGSDFSAHFLPDDLLSVAPVSTAIPMNPAQIAMRWAQHFSSQRPLRILYADGRGVLTQSLDLFITLLQQCQLAYTLIPTKNASEVYALVASGEFDMVVRGWIQDFDDPDQFFGCFEKQAPEALARHHYTDFFEKIAAARHLPEPQVRLLAYSKALEALQQEYLFVPLCRDHHRLMHEATVQVQSLCRDPFDLEESN